MLMRVEVPAVDAAFRAGFVAKWHVSPGDRVPFGAGLCDVAIDEFMALQRTKRASLLGSGSWLRRRRITDGYDLRQGRGQVTIRLTSAEAECVLHEVMVPEGGRVEVGTLIAALGTPGQNGEGDLSAAPQARVSADMPDAEEIDPFD